jgi:uncharacterized protein with FMN-binding domain
MNRAVPALAAAAVLGVPFVQSAAAAAPRKAVKSTTKTYLGPAVDADRWGPLQIKVTVRTTTTTIGTRKKVAKRITNIVVPLYPDHRGRSLYINQTALPWLIQDVLKAQSPNVQLISGATYSSEAFLSSLQGALAQASFKA